MKRPVLVPRETNPIDLTVNTGEQTFLVDGTLIEMLFKEITSESLSSFKERLCFNINDSESIETLLDNVEREIYMKRFANNDYFTTK
jgi:hypothetical protein